jgi:endonuclease YncB( thermonuclease family)
MNIRKDNRSLIKKWLDRKMMTIDVGLLILGMLGILVIGLLLLRSIGNDRDEATQMATTVSSNHSLNDGIVGVPRVVDGDTLELNNVKIRLFGIDAPEGRQLCQDGSSQKYNCGDRATRELEALIDGREVSCEPRSKDRYGRTVAVCAFARGDLGRELVLAGWAVAFEKYSRDYVNDESEAREQRLGLWQGEFERPSEYRASKNAP